MAARRDARATTSQGRATQYAPSIAEGTRPVGCSSCQRPPHRVGHRPRAEVVLWQRITDYDRLWNLLLTEMPPSTKAPGTWMHDALRVRDDWRSRLLRTTRWSPLAYVSPAQPGEQKRARELLDATTPLAGQPHTR